MESVIGQDVELLKGYLTPFNINRGLKVPYMKKKKILEGTQEKYS